MFCHWGMLSQKVNTCSMYVLAVNGHGVSSYDVGIQVRRRKNLEFWNIDIFFHLISKGNIQQQQQHKLALSGHQVLHRLKEWDMLSEQNISNIHVKPVWPHIPAEKRHLINDCLCYVWELAHICENTYKLPSLSSCANRSNQKRKSRRKKKISECG